MKSIIIHSKLIIPVYFLFSISLVIACSKKNNLVNTTPTLKAVDIQIHTDSTAQVIRGFGAANIVNWRPDMNDSEINEAFGTGQGQLGFSILRLRIPPTKSEWSSYVPTAQKAYNMGGKNNCFPWSPPA